MSSSRGEVGWGAVSSSKRQRQQLYINSSGQWELPTSEASALRVACDGGGEAVDLAGHRAKVPARRGEEEER